jgi:hypothetical protein
MTEILGALTLEELDPVAPGGPDATAMGPGDHQGWAAVMGRHSEFIAREGKNHLLAVEGANRSSLLEKER